MAIQNIHPDGFAKISYSMVPIGHCFLSTTHPTLVQTTRKILKFINIPMAHIFPFKHHKLHSKFLRFPLVYLTEANFLVAHNAIITSQLL